MSARDPTKLAVPKAVVMLVTSYKPSADLAHEILNFCSERLSPYKRIRKIELLELPKTISGKIRRAELRKREEGLESAASSQGHEYSELVRPGS